MKNLSTALKKFYFKSQNKIVFKKDITLNQLAMLIWEKEGFKGIDSSALSRIISGERSFTLRQLNIFSNILNLGNKDSQMLKEALRADILARYGFKIKFVDSSLRSNSKNVHTAQIGDSVAKLGTIENDINLLYENIYEGKGADTKERLQFLIKSMRKLNLRKNTYGSYLFNRVSLIYIRCLTDLIQPKYFQRLVSLAKNNLEFAKNNPIANLGASFRMISLTKRMQLLANIKIHSIESIGKECLELSQLALKHTPANDYAETLRNHWEAARVSLVLKNRYMFEKHTTSSFDILPKLSSGRTYLESMTWDLKARGELRFANDANSALTSINEAQMINKHNFKTVGLYLSVTKSQVLQRLKRSSFENKPSLLIYMNTPYEKLRLLEPSLIGL